MMTIIKFVNGCIIMFLLLMCVCVCWSFSCLEEMDYIYILSYYVQLYTNVSFVMEHTSLFKTFSYNKVAYICTFFISWNAFLFFFIVCYCSPVIDYKRLINFHVVFPLSCYKMTRAEHFVVIFLNYSYPVVISLG